MFDESIDDIFKELDQVRDEKASKSAERLSKFKFRDDVAPKYRYIGKKDSPKSSITSNGKRINSKYFYDIADEIKSDQDYIPFKYLLINNTYDIVDYEDNELLEEKYKLKRNVLSLEAKYKFSQEKTVKQFNNLINEYNLLKEEPLFENDYFPYLELLDIYLRKKQFSEGISTIFEFFQSEIYCDEIIFEHFKFYMELLLRRSELNLSEEQLLLVQNYEKNRENYKKPEIPIADKIFRDKPGVYLITDEKYEFNQILLYLLIKTISCRYLKFNEYIDFNVNLADCEILYFKYLAYSNLGFVSRRMNSGSKFLEYYLNAIKNKNDNGNFLQEDFDRIFECKQFEIDLINNAEEMTLQEKFDDLFSDEYRR